MINKYGIACTLLLTLTAVYVSGAPGPVDDTDPSPSSDQDQEAISTLKDVKNIPAEVEQANEVTAQSTYRQQFITQGMYVGLRHLQRGISWMAGSLGLAPCPGLFFTGKRKSCWAEVFRIFGKRNGKIRVGDLVSFYYPRARKWLGCHSGNCNIHPCPGNPSYTTGMQTACKWDRCYGNVFRIAVRGKRNGQYIQNRDAIMIQYVKDGRFYLSGHTGRVTRASCPGRSFPPSLAKYETCRGQVFEINAI